MGILNKEQVDALFHREAVMIGTSDVVPDFRIEALFGPEAVKFAHRNFDGRFCNGYGIGDYTLEYVTYRGFLIAASFYNVKQLQGMSQRARVEAQHGQTD